MLFLVVAIKEAFCMNIGFIGIGVMGESMAHHL